MCFPLRSVVLYIILHKKQKIGFLLICGHRFVDIWPSTKIKTNSSCLVSVRDNAKEEKNKKSLGLKAKTPPSLSSFGNIPAKHNKCVAVLLSPSETYRKPTRHGVGLVRYSCSFVVVEIVSLAEGVTIYAHALLRYAFNTSAVSNLSLDQTEKGISYQVGLELKYN